MKVFEVFSFIMDIALIGAVAIFVGGLLTQIFIHGYYRCKKTIEHYRRENQ